MNWYKKIILSSFNPSPEIINQINKWYDLPPEGEGLPITEIARRLNISQITLVRWFKRTGKKTRSISEQNATPYSKQQYSL